MTNDGGPAFPNPALYNGEGMSIRDYFAAQALPQAIVHALEMRSNMIQPGAFDFDGIAAAAYQMAGAMLKAREKQS